jgi:hypothetical protein
MESDGLYYFNRCSRCMGLITKLELQAAFRGDGVVCACGASMFGPTNPVGTEWLRLKTIRMIIAKLLGRLAPPPDDGVVPPVVAGTPVAPLSPDEIRAPEEGEK